MMADGTILELIAEGWGNESEGEANLPGGHIALLTIAESELFEIRQAFPHLVIVAGAWVVTQDERGYKITAHGSFLSADRDYRIRKIETMRANGEDV